MTRAELVQSILAATARTPNPPAGIIIDDVLYVFQDGKYVGA